MLVSDPAQLTDAFALERNRYVYLIGGGGKTSLMFALARLLVTAGRTVLTATSTKILLPDPAESRRVIVAPFAMGLIERLRGEIADQRHVTVASAFLSKEPERRSTEQVLRPGVPKLCGFHPDELDALAEAAVADYLLVEADGSAGRSLKAHLDHEPVLSDRAELVIVVIGVDCVGLPLNEHQVHRARLFGQRLGIAPETPLTPEHVAGIVFHRDGYLKRIGRESSVTIFLSKVASPAAEEVARGLEEALSRQDRGDRISAIVLGDVKSATSGRA